MVDLFIDPKGIIVRAYEFIPYGLLPFFKLILEPVVDDAKTEGGFQMARGVNKVILIGNLGSDPETRYMPSGDAMAKFNVATTDNWKDRQTGDNQEKTEWHSVALFGKLAEIAGQYLRKGSKVYLEGSLRTQTWQTPEGQTRSRTEIIAKEMQFLDAKGASQSDTSFAQATPENMGSNSKSSSSSNDAPLDDDVPF